MAKETKSITVSPQEEQNTIEIWQIFGWELLSSQEVFNKDSHVETRSDGVYNITSTTNYVKLLFSRENTIPNYSQLVALEKEFYNISLPTYREPEGDGLLYYGALVCGILSVVSLIGGAWYFALLLVPAAIALLIFRGKRRSDEQNYVFKKQKEANSKRAEILEKAKKLPY